MKSYLKEKALCLRKKGDSYSTIKEKIGVSKSTLTLWLRDIPYTPNKAALRKMDTARHASHLAQKKIKADSLEQARKRAKGDIANLSKRDLFMLGLGIYIGEGSKTRDIVRVVNSDPAIMRLMIAWFRNFGITNEQFRLRLFLYPDTNKEKSESFWLSATGLQKENILKAQIDVRKNKRKKSEGKLPHGTAHLTIISAGKKDFGVLFFRRILAWIEIVLNSNKNEVLEQ